ncbi:MAG: winged helix DNA-binding protein [Clostridiales bacterium]|nr:winged helix DNA-binding protein [Clostridiales bacterium]
MEQNQKELLWSAMHRLKKSQAWPPRLSGVSRGEFFMLHQVARLERKKDGKAPGGKISDLSAATEMSKPAVSQMLNSLEDKGLVERIMTKSDRRVVYVRLTEKGRERLDATARQMNELLDRVVKELGPEDTEELTRLFIKLYQIMEKMKTETAETSD